MKKNIKLKIRRANRTDLLFTLKLHNENVQDKNFFSKKKIKFKDHKIWFNEKIKEKRLFICSLNNRVGYIRYDIIDKKYLSVSIAIKKKLKRKGFGRYMLLNTLKRKNISTFNVVAVVKRNNTASKNFFLNAGFKFYKKNTYVIKSSS